MESGHRCRLFVCYDFSGNIGIFSVREYSIGLRFVADHFFGVAVFAGAVYSADGFDEGDRRSLETDGCGFMWLVFGSSLGVCRKDFDGLSCIH